MNLLELIIKYNVLLHATIIGNFLNCGKLDHTAARGTIGPVWQPRAGNNLECVYKIDSKKNLRYPFTEYIAILTWQTFYVRANMPECNQDYVIVYVG